MFCMIALRHLNEYYTSHMHGYLVLLKKQDHSYDSYRLQIYVVSCKSVCN